MDDEERAFRIEAWGGPVPHGADTWAVEAPSACEEVVTEQVVHEEVIPLHISHSTQHDHQTYMVGGDMHHSMSTSLDQMAAENLIFMAHDGMEDLSEEVQLPNDSSYNEEQYFECQVTEEVITDDWVQEQGVERLEIEMYHIKLALKLILKKPKVEIVADQLNQKSILGNDCMDDEVEVPLPTDQDEYTASRPYPCDFCSRRFRKKANLMNHMVAHQVDRPHGCNLCGARYIRKCDLMNHLKIHAYAPEQDDQQDDMEDLRDLDGILGPSESPRVSKMGQRKRKTATKRKKQREQPEHESQVKYALQAQPYEYVDEDMRLLTEAAEQHYASMNALAAEPRYPVTDSRKPFVCQHCGVGFAREKALASHARVHGGDSPFECETCGEMFWDAALLREHTRTKHQERSSNSEYEPENDESEMSDSDGKFGDYYCNTCGMSFHRVDLLRRHARLHVKKEIGDMEDVDGHVCNVCGKVFQEALDLLAHAEVHARYQPHRCMLCGETFSDEQSVTVHVTANHADMLSANSCMLCGKECRDRRSLLKHSWDHSKEREHSCSKCCKTFHNKARLKRHMVSHRNKSVSCDICGEEFPDGRSLMNHRHSHSSMSGRQFPCRECGKTFGSRSSQQIHIRIHTGERPYGCRFCWKAFADGGTLRKHERIHTGEKPYACAVCPRAFNQRVVLREHIRSHHSGPDGKRGTVEMPFCCAVCSDLFEASAELIQHLIQHSDMNTAMKRQPQVGPRKYKRRRKLKPHEMERLTRHSYDKKERAQDSDHDSDHYSVRSQERELELEPEPVRPAPAPKMKATKKSKKQLQKASMEEGYESVFKSFANALQNINSIVNNTKPPKVKKKKEIPVQARPKMIHTSKTRVAVDNPSDGKKKTKTLITRITPSETNAHVYRGTISGERNRPRTKNVSYHVLAPEKHAPAVFPDAQLQSDLESILAMATPMRIIKSEPNEMVVAANEVIMDTELENSLKEVRGMEKYNSDLVNDLEQILQSPIRTKVNSESNSVTVLDSNLMPPPVVGGIGAPSPVNITMIATEADKVTLPPPNKIETRNRGVPKKSFKFIRHVKSPLGQSGGVKKSNALINPENIKTEIMIKEELLDPLAYEGMDQVYKCEMCSESFGTRSALLVHVPIHIIC